MCNERMSDMLGRLGGRGGLPENHPHGYGVPYLAWRGFPEHVQGIMRVPARNYTTHTCGL